MQAFITWLKDNNYWLQFDATQKALAEWVAKQYNHSVVENHLFKPNGCSRIRTLWILWNSIPPKERFEPTEIKLGKCNK